MNSRRIAVLDMDIGAGVAAAMRRVRGTGRLAIGIVKFDGFVSIRTTSIRS